MKADCPNIEPPVLLEFSRKPKVLYCADVPNWSFDIKGRQYAKQLPQYDIDIAYAAQNMRDSSHYWETMAKKQHYDVIWHLHESYVPNLEDLYRKVRNFNRADTQVILTVNNVLSPQDIKKDIRRYTCFNALSVNNPWSYASFKEAGLPVLCTFDGVDLLTFGHDIYIRNRPFRVLFTASKIRLEHKGYSIWQRVKSMLPEVDFVEVITDSFNNTRMPDEMNDLYNQCQVWVCLSVSEGGPCTLLEAAACGVVPIMTRVGYADYFKNRFVIEANPVQCVEKILMLKDSPELVRKMSVGISKEILPWGDNFMAKHWGYFLQTVCSRSHTLQ